MKPVARILLSIVFVAMFFHSDGQQKQINISKNDFWNKLIAERAAKIGIQSLIDSKDSFHWRIWNEGGDILYAVDVFKASDSTYKASVSLYTEEYVDETLKKPTNRNYSKVIIISPQTALKIYKLIRSYNINQIPDQSDIKGWQEGDDGNKYIVENSNTFEYFLKTYWSPDAQENVKEAKIIGEFVGEIFALVNIKKLDNQFAKQVPFETFHAGGIMIRTRAETPAKKRKYREERDQYRKLMHIQ